LLSSRPWRPGEQTAIGYSYHDPAAKERRQ
jgi:hypothetical protein